jgi:hypothetical protein
MALVVRSERPDGSFATSFVSVFKIAATGITADLLMAENLKDISLQETLDRPEWWADPFFEPLVHDKACDLLQDPLFFPETLSPSIDEDGALCIVRSKAEEAQETPTIVCSKDSKD